MIQEEQVILVDALDIETGTAEKLSAHRKALLHRAFSVFVFNSKGEMLVHQRARAKYHSGGLWTNACCSHPRPGEITFNAANRRLAEEMGMNCNLQPAFTFIYKAELEDGLWEHELDHVFVGFSDDDPEVDAEEVQDFRYVATDELERELSENPEKFTVWFKVAFPRVVEFVGKNYATT